MNDPVEQWREKGELFKCPNTPHPFRIGRMYCEWQWAKESWSNVTCVGSLHTHALSFYSVRTLSGIKGYVAIFWRLAIRFTFQGDSK